MDAFELLVDARVELGESPIWDHRTQRVVWVDIVSGTVFEFDPLTRSNSVLYTASTNVGCVGLHTDGLVVAAGLQLLLLRKDGSVVVLAEVLGEFADHAFNDGAVDQQGRMLSGTVSITEASPTGRLLRLEHDGSVSVLIAGLTISNGIDWSNDGTTMYFVDSPNRLLEAFSYSDTLTDRRTIAAFDGPQVPDGLCVDAEDCIWVAFFNGGCIRRFGPDGKMLREIELPVSQVTSCCFGGPELETMFISTASERFTQQQRATEPTAGGLFHINPQVRGRIAHVCSTNPRGQ